jgi:hypothetical protein
MYVSNCRMYVYFDDDVRQLQSLCYCNHYYYITTSIAVLKAYAGYSHITLGEEMCERFLEVSGTLSYSYNTSNTKLTACVRSYSIQ